MKLEKYLRGERVIQYGMIATLFLPLLFTAKTMYPWHFGKALIFCICVDILFLFALWFMKREGRQWKRWGTLDWLIVGFTLSLLIAGLLGVNPERSFWGFQSRFQGVYMYMHYALYYLLLRQFFETKKEWLLFLRLFVFSAILSSTVGWLGRFFGLFEGIVRSGERLSSFVGGPIFFAAYLVIPFGLSLWLFFERREGKERWIYAGAAGVLLLSLLATQVRGAFLGLLVASSVVWYGALLSARTLRPTLRAGLGALPLVCLLLLVLVNSWSLHAYLPSFVSRVTRISLSEGSAQTRFLAWETGFAALRERPLFGWGPENFQYAFDAHYNPIFLTFSLSETIWDKAHNHFVEIAVTGGVVSLCFLLGIFGYALFLLERTLRLNKENGRSYLVLIGTLIFFAGQAFFGIETTFSQVGWYTLLAFIVWVSASGRVGGTGEERRFPVFPLWAVILLSIPLLFSLWQAIFLYRASVVMGTARDAAVMGQVTVWEEAARGALALPVPYAWENSFFVLQHLSTLESKKLIGKEPIESLGGDIIRILEDADTKAEKTHEYPLWLGQIYSYWGEYIDSAYYTTSTHYLALAGERSPGNQRVPILIAKNLLLEGKGEEGEAVLKALVAENPLAGEAHWFYGLALVEGGKDDEGVHEIEEAIRLGFSSLYNENNLHFLIDIYAKREEYDKVIPFYERLIETHPTDASLFANLAAVYAALGDIPSATHAVQEAVRLDPSLYKEAQAFLAPHGVAL